MLNHKNLVRIYNALTFIEEFYDDVFESFDLTECGKEVVENILDASEDNIKPAAEGTSAVEIAISQNLSLIITSEVDIDEDYSIEEFINQAITIEATSDWSNILEELIKEQGGF